MLYSVGTAEFLSAGLALSVAISVALRRAPCLTRAPAGFMVLRMTNTISTQTLPDLDIMHREAGYVYIGARGCQIKIGFSATNPMSRLHRLQLTPLDILRGTVAK